MKDDHSSKDGSDPVVPLVRLIHSRPVADRSAPCDDDWESLEEMIEATAKMINASEAALEDAQAMRLPSRLALTLHQKTHTAIRRLHRQVERVKIEKGKLDSCE